MVQEFIVVFTDVVKAVPFNFFRGHGVLHFKHMSAWKLDNHIL